MQDLLDKIEQETGLTLYLAQRHDNEINCCVYNFTQEQATTDGIMEHPLYHFYFVLILDSKIVSTINKFQEVLGTHLFKNIFVNAIVPLESDHKGVYQVSITGDKLL